MSSLAAALTPSTLAERAYGLIKQRIFDFELMPGDRFSELELAQQVQVSRTPLRQALQRLQREGFMQVFPKSGWLVTPLDFDQFDELYDFRILIEGYAVRHLCEAEDRPGLKALAAIWLIPAAEREPDGRRVGQLDEAFHSELVRAAGNREMLKAHRDLTERIRIIRRLDFTKPRRVEVTYQEHAKILRAITQRRSDEAQRLLRSHIEQSKMEVRHITLDMLYRARSTAAA
jgi:DNA-binding GntR family transcriptional regulator